MRPVARRVILLFAVPGSIAFSQFSEQFGKTLKHRGGAQPLHIVEGGAAADGEPRGHVAADAGLCGDDDAVADGVVAGAGGLTGEDDIPADVSRAGETDLGAEQRVLAY